MNGILLNSSFLRDRVYPWGYSTPPQCRWQGRLSKPPPSFFFHFPSSVFFCLKKQKQKLSDMVIPSALSIVLCLRKLLQKYLQAELKRQRLKRKNARRGLYNRLWRYPNKSKRQKGTFIVKLTVVFPKVGDDVTTWWREIGHRRHSNTHVSLQECKYV